MATAASKSRRRSRSKTARKRGASKSMLRSSTVSHWGNSLGFRIPHEAARKLRLVAGHQVSVEIQRDSITIRPIRGAKKWSEAELLKGVSPDMVGGEVDWDRPVGKEVW